jgi:pilus assembly protein Flp/PilA
MLHDIENGWRRLLRDDAGQNMIEYALVAGLIALGAIVAIQGLAASLSTAFSKVSSDLSTSVT